MPTITVKLDNKRAARVTRWARRSKVPKSDVIRALIDSADASQGPSGTPPRSTRRQFVSADIVVGAFASAPAIAAGRFRQDVDASIDQDPAPRA